MAYPYSRPSDVSTGRFGWLRAVILATIGALSLTLAGPVVAQGSHTGAQAFLVVVHADNPAASIERDLLSRMFLKRAAKWPDGQPAVPVDLSVNAPSRVAFSQTVHNKSVGAIRAFWQQQIFSGREVPPAEKPDGDEVVDFVRRTPGGVGYVPRGTSLGNGVKIININGEER